MSGLAERVIAPRFVADENFSQTVVAGLRRYQPALDILTSAQAGTLHNSDPEVLAWAATHDRILLSHDKGTMPAYFYTFLAQLGPGQHSPGVMLVPQTLSTGRSIAAILEIWELSGHEKWSNRLIWLPL